MTENQERDNMPDPDDVKSFIRENLATLHLVSQVADHFGKTEDALRMWFLRQEQHSISVFMHEERLSVLARLLAETDMPVAEVCATAGYSRPESAARAFRKRFGVSMRDFRQDRQAA